MSPRRRPAAEVTFATATGLRPLGRASRGGTWTAHTRGRGPWHENAALQARRSAHLLGSRGLDALPPRIDTIYVFGGQKGRAVRRQHFRRREWGPAVDSAGVPKPARIYDLRSTFASEALAAGITDELARIMGTSVSMIEAHYGALIDTAREFLLDRLESLGHLRGTSRKGLIWLCT